MHPILKRCIDWGGSILAVLGLIFVALQLCDYGTDIDFARFNLTAWSVLGGFAIIYGLSNLMLALAWRNLLGQFGAGTSRLWAIRTYGLSQIAKYVPGNIFHLAGRQAIGMKDGVRASPLIKSAVWELVLISSTAVLFIVLTLPLIHTNFPTKVGALGFPAVMGIAAALFWRFIGPQFTRAFGLYVVFLAISGLLFLGIIQLMVVSPGISDAPWFSLCGAYVLAWLVGLITPGAPAGVGVRELVLLFLLKGIVGEADLLLAVILGRVMTVTGDFVFFLIALSTNRNS
ncbi:hypothetical protein DSCA_09860 [Desulfosarcina alkanivorans]|uniref:Flippase-like domain-containing protein n=1 Tax=Desulfosarcina alkanivorans TaxID=571177 RepID=A0A5K7YDJ9_9BACT|nr:hypothetical protein [Desulfosarcina alkanivorans]BBO67056.1 hypothetical protein DSCA_09860 [Desulfosarcina alkanivorans]